MGFSSLQLPLSLYQIAPTNAAFATTSSIVKASRSWAFQRPTSQQIGQQYHSSRNPCWSCLQQWCYP
eukprot:10014738-Ditylum_brightwellii.AAC.1